MLVDAKTISSVIDEVKANEADIREVQWREEGDKYKDKKIYGEATDYGMRTTDMPDLYKGFNSMLKAYATLNDDSISPSELQQFKKTLKII